MSINTPDNSVFSYCALQTISYSAPATNGTLSYVTKTCDVRNRALPKNCTHLLHDLVQSIFRSKSVICARSRQDEMKPTGLCLNDLLQSKPDSNHFAAGIDWLTPLVAHSLMTNANSSQFVRLAHDTTLPFASDYCRFNPPLTHRWLALLTKEGTIEREQCAIVYSNIKQYEKNGGDCGRLRYGFWS